MESSLNADLLLSMIFTTSDTFTSWSFIPGVHSNISLFSKQS